MQLGFATMPRSGSQFLIRLTKAILESGKPETIVAISPGRLAYRDDSLVARLREGNDLPSEKFFTRFRRRFGIEEKGKLWMLRNTANKDGLDIHETMRGAVDENLINLLEKVGSRWINVEAPGSDTLCYDLAARFPEARWLGTIRRIENVITSHHNLATWGWSEQQVLTNYIHDLAFYEHVAMRGRLFLVNIDEPQRFNPHKMLTFLGGSRLSAYSMEFVKNWAVVNPLKKQQKKSGQAQEEKRIPPNLHTLRTRHLWISEIENRYFALWGMNG